MLITHTQVDELLSTLTHLSGLDEELAATCAALMRAERYDEAVSRAFVILEERLRGLLGVRGGAGVHLARKAFNSKSGDFVDRIGRPAAEVEGIRDLFVGAFRAYRNRAAHTVVGYSLQEAQGIIHLANLLLSRSPASSPAPSSSPSRRVPWGWPSCATTNSIRTPSKDSCRRTGPGASAGGGRRVDLRPGAGAWG